MAPSREAAEDIVTAPAPLAGVDEAWSSDHRPVGIFVAAGPRIAAGRSDELSLYDVAPTALALLEKPVPSGLDGKVARVALDRSFLRRHPVEERDAPIDKRASETPAFSDEEAAAVAEHLKDLGYIE